MKRLALAFVEGFVRELGGRALEQLEDWIDDRRREASRGTSSKACPTCGRALCCPVHAVNGEGVAVVRPAP